MTTGWSRRVAGLLVGAARLPEGDREVLAYGLEVVLVNMLGLVVALAAGLATGLLRESLVVVACLFFTRRAAGGAHCTSLGRCAIVTAGSVPATAALSRLVSTQGWAVPWAAVAVAIALVAVYLYAPADTPAKPITGTEWRRALRRRCFFTIAGIGVVLVVILLIPNGSLAWAASSASSALLVQGLALTPGGYRVMAVLDRMLGAPLRTGIERGGIK